MLLLLSKDDTCLFSLVKQLRAYYSHDHDKNGHDDNDEIRSGPI